MIKNTFSLSSVELGEDDMILDCENPKFLLLGTSNSGKTTLMNLILGNAKQISLQTIHNEILNNIRKVCEKCLQTDSISSRLHNQYISHCRTILESIPKKNDSDHSPTSSKTLSQSFPLVSNMSNIIIDLWTNCLVFRETFEEFRDELNISDSCEYFLNSTIMERLCNSNCGEILNLKDVLHVRMETKGIDNRKVFYSEMEGFPRIQQSISDEKFFQKYSNCISVLDFGGNSRRKWKGYFHNVTMGVFLVNLSSYNKKSKEFPEKNEMVDSLELFEEMVNHECFVNTPILLLFNKHERFCNLIERGKDIDCVFPEYENRGQSPKERIDSSLSYIKLKFESKAWSRKDNLHCRFISLLCPQDANQVLLDMLTLSKLLKEDSTPITGDKKIICSLM